MFLSLATMRALTDSILTVAGQWTPGSSDLPPDGSSTETRFVVPARADGMHALFAQKDALEAQHISALVHSMVSWDGPLPNLDNVAAMLAFAQAHDVKLTLVIKPDHADALEIFRRAGLWPRVEQFKAELAALAARQGSGTVLWDFMDYSAFTTEQVPPAGDRHTATRWFWEPSHFKKALGRIMLGRILGDDAPAFGVVLTPDNVAERNAAVRAQRQAYLCGNNAGLAAEADKRSADGCVAVERVAKQRGPT